MTAISKIIGELESPLIASLVTPPSDHASAFLKD